MLSCFLYSGHALISFESGMPLRQREETDTTWIKIPTGRRLVDQLALYTMRAGIEFGTIDRRQINLVAWRRI